jgi:hypothetical protein
MGASESKLVFKQGIFRLSEDKRIPPDDPYWTGVSSTASPSVALPLDAELDKPRLTTYFFIFSSGSYPSRPKMFSVYSRLLIYDGPEMHRYIIWKP